MTISEDPSIRELKVRLFVALLQEDYEFMSDEDVHLLDVLRQNPFIQSKLEAALKRKQVEQMERDNG